MSAVSTSPDGIADITIRFNSGKRQQVFTCSPEDQLILGQRSEFFATLLEGEVNGGSESAIDLFEDDAIAAINFLTELLRNTPASSYTVGWNFSWVLLAAKWQAREYTQVFADMADRHIKKMIGDVREKKKGKSFCMLVPSSTHITGFENQIYDPTNEKNKFGYTLYAMRGDANKVVDFWQPTRTWQWKLRSNLGGNFCYAYDNKAAQGNPDPPLEAVTEIKTWNQTVTPNIWSEPTKVSIVPIESPAVVEPPLCPSAEDLGLFWAICETILLCPCLAKPDGLVRQKDDLLKVLTRKKHLMDKEAMKRIFSPEDWFDLTTKLSHIANERE
jgi:hypothetical protein